MKKVCILVFFLTLVAAILPAQNAASPKEAESLLSLSVTPGFAYGFVDWGWQLPGLPGIFLGDVGMTVNYRLPFFPWMYVLTGIDYMPGITLTTGATDLFLSVPLGIGASIRFFTNWEIAVESCMNLQVPRPGREYNFPWAYIGFTGDMSLAYYLTTGLSIGAYSRLNISGNRGMLNQTGLMFAYHFPSGKSGAVKAREDGAQEKIQPLSGPGSSAAPRPPALSFGLVYGGQTPLFGNASIGGTPSLPEYGSYGALVDLTLPALLPGQDSWVLSARALFAADLYLTTKQYWQNGMSYAALAGMGVTCHLNPVISVGSDLLAGGCYTPALQTAAPILGVALDFGLQADIALFELLGQWSLGVRADISVLDGYYGGVHGYLTLTDHILLGPKSEAQPAASAQQPAGPSAPALTPLAAPSLPPVAAPLALSLSWKAGVQVPILESVGEYRSWLPVVGIVADFPLPLGFREMPDLIFSAKGEVDWGFFTHVLPYDSAAGVFIVSPGDVMGSYPLLVTAGLGTRLNLARWFGLSGDAQIGFYDATSQIYQSSSADSQRVQPGFGLRAGAGADLAFEIAGWNMSFGLRGEYANLLGLWQGMILSAELGFHAPAVGGPAATGAGAPAVPGELTGPGTGQEGTEAAESFFSLGFTPAFGYTVVNLYSGPWVSQLSYIREDLKLTAWYALPFFPVLRLRADGGLKTNFANDTYFYGDLGLGIGLRFLGGWDVCLFATEGIVSSYAAGYISTFADLLNTSAGIDLTYSFSPSFSLGIETQFTWLNGRYGEVAAGIISAYHFSSGTKPVARRQAPAQPEAKPTEEKPKLLKDSGRNAATPPSVLSFSSTFGGEVPILDSQTPFRAEFPVIGLTVDLTLPSLFPGQSLMTLSGRMAVEYGMFGKHYISGMDVSLLSESHPLLAAVGPGLTLAPAPWLSITGDIMAGSYLALESAPGASLAPTALGFGLTAGLQAETRMQIFGQYFGLGVRAAYYALFGYYQGITLYGLLTYHIPLGPAAAPGPAGPAPEKPAQPEAKPTEEKPRLLEKPAEPKETEPAETQTRIAQAPVQPAPTAVPQPKAEQPAPQPKAEQPAPAKAAVVEQPKPAVVEQPKPQAPEQPAPAKTAVAEPAKAAAPEPQKPVEERGKGLAIRDLAIGNIFPIFHTFYDDHPIGKLTLKNTEYSSVTDVAVSLIIRQYMDAPKECATMRELKAGEERSVDLYALFKNTILDITQATKVAAEISVSYTLKGKPATAGKVETIRIYDRNAMTWDDDRKAAAFVTPKEPAVLIFSNNINAALKGKLNRAVDRNLQTAIALHDALRLYGISYVSNPLTPYAVTSQDKGIVDTLKFPRQTFEYRSGDCSDLSILYSALMESVQIETAFITIPGHIFMAFALRATPEEIRQSFSQTDELIFRNDKVWVPVEVTEREKTFIDAWQLGAKEWRENLSRNQADFYPVHDAWAIYEPVGLPGSGSPPVLPDPAQVVKDFRDDVARLVDREIFNKVAALQAAITKSQESPKSVNALGVLYARYDLTDKAEREFKKAAAKTEFVPALVNLGNLAYLKGDMEGALGLYNRAYKKDPKHPGALLGIARASHEIENYATVKKAFGELKAIDPDLASRFAYLELKGEEATRAADIAEVKDLIVWQE